MGITFILISALALAICNLFLRQGIEKGGASQALLLVQLFFCFLMAILLCPIMCGIYTINVTALLLGAVTGAALASMAGCFMRSLELGPPGLTIAIQNASMLFPLLLFLFLNPAWGMPYSVWNGLGSVLVLVGLFWAARGSLGSGKASGAWVFFAVATFFFNTIFLFLTQWRGIHNRPPTDFTPFLPMEAARNHWFMPMVYLTATVIFVFIFFTRQKRALKKTEWRYGAMAGVFAGVGIFFLIKATEVGTRWEQSFLLPLFAVAIIILCNIWGKLFYKEQVNWWANGLACLGIAIGALNWEVLFA